MKTYYKKTSTGKIQQWRIFIEEAEGGYCVKTEQGQVGGKLTTTAGKLITKGKNIGKANETTPYQQAEQEVTTKQNKKFDEGYKETQEEALNDLVLLPMLAHTFDKRKHNIEYPAFGQAKFDGCRLMAWNKPNEGPSLFTRKGKLYPHLEHVKEETKTLPDNVVLDGEIYSHDLPFEKITGLVRRETMSDSDMSDMFTYLKYFVYDIVLLDEPDATFEERYARLVELVEPLGDCIVVVPNVELSSEEDVKAKHDKFVEEGYEGIMIRNKKGDYGINKRSKHLQKFKAFKDDEYTIVGFTEGQSNETGCVIWTCVTTKGQQFNVRPRGTQEERRKLFSEGDQHIGELLVVRFQELSQDGIPRFPVGVGIRWKDDV